MHHLLDCLHTHTCLHPAPHLPHLPPDSRRLAGAAPSRAVSQGVAGATCAVLWCEGVEDAVKDQLRQHNLVPAVNLHTHTHIPHGDK